MEKSLREKLQDGKFNGLTPARSRAMSSVKGRGNRSTEIRLRLALVRFGVRGWCLHPKGIPGKPDFFFPKKRVAIFVDGCFWHACPTCGHIPKTNRPFWQEKLRTTSMRDRKNTKTLRHDGIRVLRFWEHDVLLRSERCVKQIQEFVYADAKTYG